MSEIETFPTPNLSQEQWEEMIRRLNYKELNDIRAAIAVRMKDMRDTGITQLRATIAEQATLLGVDLKDLIIPKKTRKRRKKDDDGVDAPTS